MAQLPMDGPGARYGIDKGVDRRPESLDHAGEAVVHAFATKASSLKIHYMPARTLPPLTWNIRTLKALEVDFSPELTKLPESIANLKELTKLTVHGAPLESLPTSIGGLPKLATLSLSGGSYETLPLGFTRLGSSLQNLEITHSRPALGGGGGGGGLKELPANMGAFKLLQNLKICGHKELTEIPASVGDLTQLRTVDFSYCPKLTSIPDLSKLRHLKTLNLSGCTGLSAPPEWLKQLPGRCEVILPKHLTEQRPVRDAAQSPARFQPRPPEETAQREQKLEDWVVQLKPFASERGSSRFNLWMGEMIRRAGRESSDMGKIDAVVKAATDSPAFRADLFAFAAANVQVPRNSWGVQQTDRAVINHVDATDAHNLLIEHRLSDPRQMTAAQAYGALTQLTIEQEAFSQALVPLAFGKAGSHHARVPPLLASYVQTHDPVGSALMEEKRKLSPREAAAGATAMQEVLYHRCVAVANQLLQTGSGFSDSPSRSASPRR